MNDNFGHEVQERLIDAFGEERREYAFGTYQEIGELKLYDTVKVAYNEVIGFFRVLKITRTVDSGFSELTVWGTPNSISGSVSTKQKWQYIVMAGDGASVGAVGFDSGGPGRGHTWESKDGGAFLKTPQQVGR